MSSTSTPGTKRSISEVEDGPNFDDATDLTNAVISSLQYPDEKTNVSINYSNDKNLATEVQAYAKISGCNWTFYVKSLAISIGRNTDNNQNSSSFVDIDLGPAKVVSRQHATITYNLDLRCWELKILGRNGAKVDGQKVNVESPPTPLHSGAILDIGGTQMMFILPDSPPKIDKRMMDLCLSRYKVNMSKQRRVSNPINGNGFSNNPYTYFPQQHTLVPQTNKTYQMFDKPMNHSPSQLSASSLQSNLDQDLSREESKDIKPPYSYATMITQAILSNENGVMSLSEIYDWIASHYAYYKYSKTGWQNSIRHNLSLNKAFEKVPRRPNEPGKGMKWQISESYKDEFLNKIQNGSISKARRGSSVSRQLQLHLATHQSLPESNKYYTRDDKRLQYDYSYPPQSNQSGQPQNLIDQSQPMVPQMQVPPLMYNIPDQSPMRLDLNTPKLPKVNNNLFNLPPPNSGPGHSRLNSYNQLDRLNSYQPDSITSESIGNSEVLGFTSPKKVQQLEAFTPERGSKSVKLIPGLNNQSSPAFWNFVQFSTPNGQTPMRKDGDENGGSPSLRKVVDDKLSPLKKEST